jgi:hypothetical protein
MRDGPAAVQEFGLQPNVVPGVAPRGDRKLFAVPRPSPERP